MDRFYFLTSILVFAGCLHGQLIEEIEDVVLDQNEKLFEYFKGQQRKITSLEDGLRTVVETLQDMQRIMMLNFQEQREENKLCAKQDQLEDFKNTYESGTDIFKASLERSSCTEQLQDFQDMLATDECEAGTHNCSEAATCTNELILYKCVCHAGYFGDGFTCTDIDECDAADVKCGVNSICTNHPGSYKCQCHEGYEVGVNGCRDIDECQRGQYECQSRTSCINIDGSYECQCTPPYSRVGEFCKLDCKSPSLDMGDIGCITLIHTGMTWSDAHAECKRLDMRLLEDLKVEHLEPLDRHFTPLRSFKKDTWIGFQNGNWVTSGHSVASELVAREEGELESECGTFDMRSANDFGLWDVDCTRTYDALCQTFNKH